jgi:iron uptake system component EfeO
VSGVAIVAVAVLLTSCSSSARSSAGPTTTVAGPSVTSNTGADNPVAGNGPTTKVAITLTPQGCAPEPPSIPAGQAEFAVDNKDARTVTEAALESTGGDPLGRTEHIAPGQSGTFSRTLRAGTYRITCPGAQQAGWDLRVTAVDAAEAWESNPELVAAVNGYAVWVRQEVAKLALNTSAFVAAVKAGQIDQAKNLYAKARVGYESVEPVAESFGDLDKEIDGRLNDFLDPDNFSGFHRIERALFTRNSVNGMTPIADRLLQNINQLQRLVAQLHYTPVELASGATELVNEIEESKITGEEESYSGIDLVDFRGNLDGAIELVHELTPFLRKNDPTLLATINARDAAVNASLVKYERSPGYVDSGFVDYDVVTDPERRQLSVVINSLAEEISALVVVVSK